MQRRRFLQTLSAGSLASLLPNLACAPTSVNVSTIDRQALVARHAPVVRTIDPFSVLSVGNGRFAFTADVTGLQSFPDAYPDIPLATQSEWGWHSFPNPEGYTLADAQTLYDAHGRPVPYADQQFSDAGQWLRQSPHRLSLARIGFDLRRADDTPALPGDLHDIEKRRDHPTLLGAYGFVGSPDADPEIMRRTLHRVMESWQWEETWGWDYPLVAMTATRLGEPEIALDALLMDTEKNRHLPNGHNYQREGLTIYLPGNGGLLAAVAMMAAGWEDGPDTHAPGFPAEGWNVQWEGLQRFL